MTQTRCSCCYSHYTLAKRSPGEPVTALCGKVWVPSMVADCHEPCPECRELVEALSTRAGWVA